jgi:anti-sigma factor RsiW
MNHDRHLTEDERQTLADDAVPAERRAELDAHLATCTECFDDVARLREITMRYKATPRDPEPVDELWPSIRSRIEQHKVVPLDAAARQSRRWSGTRRAVAVGVIAAGTMLTIVLLRPSHRIVVDSTLAQNDTSALRLVTDSVRSYEDESRVLLNRLELQRAMLRPEAAASIDRDLKVIDQAIAELQTAIQNDPRNPALRRLLASSYRQKVELLKRASNAS